MKIKGTVISKKDLAEIIVKGLAPLRERYKELEQNPNKVIEILKEGTKTAKENAARKLTTVKNAIGLFLPKDDM